MPQSGSWETPGLDEDFWSIFRIFWLKTIKVVPIFRRSEKPNFDSILYEHALQKPGWAR